MKCSSEESYSSRHSHLRWILLYNNEIVEMEDEQFYVRLEYV